MSKNIVVCYDGTNAEYSNHNTNVVRTYEAIERDASQVTFYDPGVGTFSYFGRKLGRLTGTLLGMAFGYGIRENIEDGYEYLMNTYNSEDMVYIFGFSRGAYTARALAGMIHQFGILQKGSKNLIPYVSKMYFKNDKDKDFTVISGFKKTFCHACEPRLIGIWDTVSALGLNLSKRFTNLRLNPDVQFGYHAISIDEKRRPYKVVLWDESSKAKNQVIEQVWFAGVHSEVGGGCTKDNCSLPDISLLWMLEKASECGLRLKANWQKGFKNDFSGKIHESCKLFPWVILGLRKTRRIPEGANIHQSVVDRMKTIDTYKPLLPSNKNVVK
jgi:uncharacterized protein (DUF2235 family)